MNEQIAKELYSAYLYLSMAAYFEARNLSGCAHWMKIQAKEETEHAMKFFEFLNDVGERVILEAIEKPLSNFSSVVGVFEATLAHEKEVTASIHKLYELAQKVNEYPASVLLQWFINEQVEEEKNATAILEKLKMIKVESGALLMLDAQLGKRGE